ncbi:ser/Thr protein phosphatase family protein [Stachybotrys elegans]|uniref:Ser/Thr protein phosphatase family protein n=1 Tax=Stachybotrys elegans TaxID=80388 RepID=A0A8K0SQK6_9HYPO|nr:ser/Thr protein phosphatase family protein [Stachybotrys elegans]
MVKTRILIISDTHGTKPVPPPQDGSPPNIQAELTFAGQVRRQATGYRDPLPEADVVLHCGDLTKRSRISEFQNTFDMLRGIKAPLKLCIAGNHDMGLDEDYWKLEYESDPGLPEYVKTIISDARQDGVRYLTEGTYTFDLENGARLTVYASQYTPMYGGWAFQYPDRHDFDIPQGVDIAMTHGPPKGVLDLASNRSRAGCPQLFQAVHHARPKIHCFGHIHEGWGAYIAKWTGDEKEGAFPRVETVIDALNSRHIKHLQDIWPMPFTDDDKVMQAKLEKLVEISKARGVHVDLTAGEASLAAGQETLFVNAAIMDTGYKPSQPPWIVDVDLPSQ